MRSLAATALTIALASAHVYGEIQKIRFVGQGEVISSCEAREAPPYGLFDLFIGKKIGEIQPGTRVAVRQKHTYSGFSGTRVWYEISPPEAESVSTEAGDGGSVESQSWWIYGGVEGETSCLKFQALPPNVSVPLRETLGVPGSR